MAHYSNRPRKPGAAFCCRNKKSRTAYNDTGTLKVPKLSLIHIFSDRALGGADTLATGYPLAKAAEKLGDYDLLICGRHATDAETAQTGPIIAAFLGIPQVTLVDKVSIEDGYAICRRMLPDRYETVKVKLPALITVCSEINTCLLYTSRCV